jgi:hypothetical protein
MEGAAGGDKVKRGKPHPKSQVRIKFKDLDADKAVVEKILLAAASKFDLKDNSETSRVPDTIRSVIEGKGIGFGLGARVVGEYIFVDFGRQKSESPKYDQAHDFILKELEHGFHVELQEIWEDNPVYCKTYWKK